MPRYPTVPAVRLGRLLVSIDARGQELGAYLLFDALARALRREIAWTVFIVGAKDEAARRLYLGFVGSGNSADEPILLTATRGAVGRLFGST